MQKASIEIPNEELLEKTINETALETLKDTFDFAILAGSWEQFRAMWAEEESTDSPFSIRLKQANNSMQQEVKAIGDRFIRKEIAGLDDNQPIWNNKEFTARLKNAASYFIPKLTAISTAVNEFYTEKKDTNLPAEFYDCLNILSVNLKTKMAAFVRLPAASSGADILSSVKEAGVNFRPIYKNWNAKPVPKEKEIINPELYKQLLNWRKETSSNRKILEFNLLSDTILREITAKLPRSLNQLSQIKGFGDVKATDFGEQILKLIRSFLGENDLFA